MSKPIFRLSLLGMAVAATLQLTACGGGSAGAPDVFPPTVTIASDAVDTATGPVTFTFDFNEDVGSSFTADDLTVTGGVAGALTRVSATQYTLVVTPPADATGDIRVTVKAEAFSDAAGNLNKSGPTVSQTFNTRSAPAPDGSGNTDAPPPAANNLLTNGDFESGNTGWTGNARNVVTEGGNSFNLASVGAKVNPWDVNLSYPLSIPTAGVQYRLTFKASSNRARVLRAGIGLNVTPFDSSTEDVNLTTTLQTFELTFTSNFANENSRVLFDMGHDTGDVVIDDVVLVRVDDQTPAPTPLTFASNYTESPPWRTAQGGDAGRYAADGALDWWSGLAAGAATPNFYFGYVLLPTDWGFGAFVNAPGNATATVSSYSNIQISVWGNDELVNQSPRPNFNLILQAPAVGQCIPEVQREFQVTGAGAQTYTLALSSMLVRQDCGQPNLNTAAAILATGVKSVHVQVTTANLNKTTGMDAGSGRYPNGLNIGPISFN